MISYEKISRKRMISDCRSPYQENLRPGRSVACWLEARGSHQHNSTSDLRHTSMFWEVEIKERHKEKNTRIIVPSPFFSHTFEGVSEWDLLNMLNHELINCASHSLSMSIVSFFNLRAPICVQKKQYVRQNVSSWPLWLPPLTFIGVPNTSSTSWTSSGC